MARYAFVKCAINPLAGIVRILLTERISFVSIVPLIGKLRYVNAVSSFVFLNRYSLVSVTAIISALHKQLVRGVSYFHGIVSFNQAHGAIHHIVSSFLFSSPSPLY